MRLRNAMLAVALGAALVVASGVDDAAARRRPSKVAAAINGKHRKWGTRKVGVVVLPGSVNIIATVKRPHRLNQFIPGVAISCQLDLAGVFPITPVFPQICVLGYSEVRFSANPDPKMWGGSNFDGAVQVTFDSFDGGRLRGNFRGTLTSQNTPANPAVTIENGTFSVDVGG